MTRMTARELAVHAVFTLDFAPNPGEILDERLSPEYYSGLSEEDELFEKAPDDAQSDYIRTLVTGVSDHLAELDSYIDKYAVGWSFGRLPRTAVAVMRVCMYEVLYRQDIPNAAAINAAVEISKKYEPAEMTAFINGILGTFTRSELPDDKQQRTEDSGQKTEDS